MCYSVSVSVCVCLCEMYVCVMCVCVCALCVFARVRSSVNCMSATVLQLRLSYYYVCVLNTARTTMHVSSTQKIGLPYARGTCAMSLSVY